MRAPSDAKAPTLSTKPAPAVPTARGFGPAEFGLLLTLSAMWGLSFLFIEIALRAFGPFAIVAGRTGIGGLVLLVILRLRGRHLPRSLRVWGHLLVLGSVNNALPWSAVAWAQQSLPSGLVALLMAVVPTSTLLVAALAGMERITGRRLVGLLLALGGVATIALGDIDQPGRMLAIAAVGGATLLYASGAVYAKRYVSGSVGPLSLATGQVVCAFVVSIPAALLVDPLPQAAEMTWGIVAALTALGVFGTGLAFLIFYTLIERVGATNATMTTYLIPLVAVVAGTVFLGERLGAVAIAGGAMIGLGIWLAQRGTRPGSTIPGTEPDPPSGTDEQLEDVASRDRS